MNMGHVYRAFSRPLSAYKVASRTVYRALVCVEGFSTLPDISSQVSEEFSAMETISDVSTKPIVGSPYIKPLQMSYTQNGKKKTWDVIVSHDSVAILIHNITRDVFVFVRQFRPAVYLSSARSLGLNDSEVDLKSVLPPSTGFTYELCAGIIDKRKSIAEIAIEELQEECGYEVTEDCLEEITRCRSSVGISGSEQTLFYARVTDSMKTGKGGGNPDEGELIEVVEVPVAEGIQFVMDKTKDRPVGMLFALMWFHSFKHSTKSELPCELSMN